MAYQTKPSTLNKVWASTGTKTQPSDSKIAQGWVTELPPYQYDNWLMNRLDTFVAHVNQNGIPEWDSGSEYIGGSSYVRGSNGKIYKAILTNTNIDPTNVLNAAYWSEAFDAFGSAAAVSTALNTHITNYGVLTGLTNLSAARTNLSVWSRAESDAKYALKSGDVTQTFTVAPATQPEHAVQYSQLSSILSQATQASVGVLRFATSSEVEIGASVETAVSPATGNAVYLKKSGNLSGLGNTATARANLGLGSAAVMNTSAFLQPGNNLSDLSNIATARANLGLTSTAQQPESYFLRAGQNLADLANAGTARNNLGLSAVATLPFGTTANTVAAGDDSRIVNAVPNTRSVNAGNGLSGGGALGGDVWLSMGQPSTISSGSTNSASGTTHTHALDVSGFFADRQLADNGWYTFPGGFTIQWGYSTANSNYISFPKAFTTCFNVQVTPAYVSGVGDLEYDYGVNSFNATGAYLQFWRFKGNDGGGTDSARAYWVAYGVV